MALYHSARGSVGYTIVGSPTIVDGVVSGFAGGSNLQGNYLKTQFLPDFTGDVEIGIKFKTDTLAYGVLMSWITSGVSCYISINASGRPACFFSKTGANSTSLVINSTDHSFAFTTGQDCYLKVTKTTEGTLTMYHSNDGQAYTQFATKTNANYGTSRVSSYCRIGVNASYNPGQAFNGSIDLNETYINVNGQPWFGICPVEVKKHQIMGPVGYTVVGSPTIVDGVVSNFSLSSYVQIPAFMPGNKTWALQLKFKLNSSMTNSSALFNDTNNDFRCPKVSVIPGTSSLVFRAFVSTTGSNWNVSGGPQRRVSFDYSKWAYILWEFTGSQYILSFKQEGQDYSIITTINSTEPFYQNQNQVGMSFGNDIGSVAQYNSYIDGSIDLNETYIKVNGKLWFWQPQETKRIVVNGVEVWTKPE